MNLTYKGHVAPEDIVGRILGPDLFNAYSTVTSSEYIEAEDVTRVTVKPSVSDTDTIFDEWGQMWRFDSV